MAYTENEIQQMEMFGCLTSEIRADFEEARNKKMFLMSILSDAQDISCEENRRQLLNVAKYIIDQLLEIK